MRRFTAQIAAVFLFTLAGSSVADAQGDWEEVYLEDSLTHVQPMTGIVFWTTSGHAASDAISLEFSYMLFNEVVSDSGMYDWEAVDRKLEAVAGRKHQAIFRFRYTYPGRETSVPDYILAMDDYEETVGLSEGRETHFPDWSHPELQRFTLEFYTRFAERYGEDPRLAFIQVGFGLWGEYHIYSGPFELGRTFPSKEFQETFFRHLDTTLVHIPWSISIDAADDTYSPFEEKPSLLEIPFGLFDDSFMHRNHAGYNTRSWNFFDRERYRTSPAGGEFSYYSDYDQEHVLDYPDGPYGRPFEEFAKDFHITYMIGNDQPAYQTMDRIRDASMAAGYRFQVVSLKSRSDSSVFGIRNYGVAPIYYDAWIAVDGVRSPVSLKLLSPGDTLYCGVQADARYAEITIECDKLVEGQEIEFHGMQEITGTFPRTFSGSGPGQPYPNPLTSGQPLSLKGISGAGTLRYEIYNCRGQLTLAGALDSDPARISTSGMEGGFYIMRLFDGSGVYTHKIMIL
ncbi:MAG: T9SS type A sorting domain-containing protein [Bacteroidales bacterium]